MDMDSDLLFLNFFDQNLNRIECFKLLHVAVSISKYAILSFRYCGDFIADLVCR